MNKTGEDWAEKKNHRPSYQDASFMSSCCSFTKLEDEALETENEIPDTKNSKIKHLKLKREIVMVVYWSINLIGHNFEILILCVTFSPLNITCDKRSDVSFSFSFFEK